MFCRRECPWKSRYISIELSSLNLLTNRFKAATSGKSIWFLLRNYRLRSIPDAPALEFPKITPSGFSMGTTMILSLNKGEYYFYRRNFIYSLLHSSFIKRDSIRELLDSPGWALPVIIMIGFCFVSSCVFPKHT